MWPSLCCRAQRTSSRSNLNGVEQGEQDGTVAIQYDARASQQASSSQENKVGMNFPALESQKLRHSVKLELPPRSQSMWHTLEQSARSETFSLFDTVTHDVIQNPSTGASNTSLDSDYKTPPSTIAGDPPNTSPRISKPRVRKKSLSLLLPASQDSLSSIQEPAHSQYHHHSFQTLLSRIEEAEKQRQKQHEELLKKIDMLVTEIKESKESAERRVSTDGVKQAEREGEILTDSGGSLLPQNTRVSRTVLLRLSERVTRKWKFLARELGIEEHDIQQIKGDNQGDTIQEQSYQMLLKWKESNGGGCYQKLGDAVRTTYGKQLHSEYVQMVINFEGKHSVVANSQ